MIRSKQSKRNNKSNDKTHKKQIKRTQKKRDNDDDINEDALEETETKNVGYDATRIDNGKDGDLDNEDWSGNDIDEGDDAEDAEEDLDAEMDEDMGGDVDVGVDEDCSYNVSRKVKGPKKLGAMIDKEDDDDDNGIDYNVDENELTEDLYVKPEERRTAKHLFLYEKVRLLGDRTAQLAQGAKPMIKGVEGLDPRTIAQLELESKKIPIIIIRPLTNGKKEKWYLSELRLKKKYIIYGFEGDMIDKVKVDRIKGEYQKGGSIIGYSHLAEEVNKPQKESIQIDEDTNKVVTQKQSSQSRPAVNKTLKRGTAKVTKSKKV